MAPGLLYTVYGVGIIATRIVGSRWLDRVGTGQTLLLSADPARERPGPAAFAVTPLWLWLAVAADRHRGSGLFHPVLIAPPRPPPPRRARPGDGRLLPRVRPRDRARELAARRDPGPRRADLAVHDGGAAGSCHRAAAAGPGRPARASTLRFPTPDPLPRARERGRQSASPVLLPSPAHGTSAKPMFAPRSRRGWGRGHPPVAPGDARMPHFLSCSDWSISPRPTAPARSSMTSRSPSPAARRSPSSAPTAPARRPCSASSAARRRPTAEPSSSPTAGPSGTCHRTPASRTT